MSTRILTACSVATMFVFSGCGVAADPAPPTSGANAGRQANLMISVSGEDGGASEASCMLHWKADNRQDRRVTLMLGVAMRDGRNGAELSDDQMTVSMGVPARGSADYPAYSLSGANCADLELAITSLMCVGGECVAHYTSQGVAQLTEPES